MKAAAAERQGVDPVFFETPEELCCWFTRHHETARELLAGFYKKDSGRRSIT